MSCSECGFTEVPAGAVTCPRCRQPVDGNSIPETRVRVHQEVGVAKGNASVVGVQFQYAERVTIEANDEAKPPAEGDPPYKGLRYFDVDDAPLFFGREKVTAELVDYLREHAFLAVIGASGSGKSSLARAGVVAALQEDKPLEGGVLPPTGSRSWPLYLLTPTAHPLEALVRSLSQEDAVRLALLQQLRADPFDASVLRRHLAQTTEANSRSLLVVDQFEEIFTLCRDENVRRRFVDNLLHAAGVTDEKTEGNSDGSIPAPATLILTLRADFYSQCAAFDNLRYALERFQRYIGPMNQDELQRAIELPAQNGNWAFQQGLVELLLKDVSAQPGALPLLSHALLETWKRRSGRTLTITGYNAAGGVQGAIARTADQVYGDELSPAQQVIARNIFLRLTELGEGVQDTRRRVALDELFPQSGDTEQVKAVLKTLTDARLVTTDEDPVAADSVRKEAVVEVAHEALIREWPALRRWLDENRDSLRIHRALTEAAETWKDLEQDAGSLYRGVRLDQALEWRQAHEDDLNALERDFLDASETEQRREIEEEKERQRERERQQQERAEAAEKLATEQGQRAQLFRRGLMIVAGLLVLAMVAGVLAYRNQQLAAERLVRAEQAEAQALGRYFVSEGRRIFEGAGDNETAEESNPYAPLLGLRLAAEGLAVAPDEDKALREELAVQVATLAETGRMLSLSGRLAEMPPAGSPAEGFFVVGGGVTQSAVWLAPDGTAVADLTDSVSGVNWSLDGSQMVVRYKDVPSELWRIAGDSAAKLADLPGHWPRVEWSSDGSHAVVRDSGAPSELWRVASDSAAKSADLTGSNSVSLSPNKSYIVADYGTFVQLWRITGNSAGKLTDLPGPVSSVEWSPDGSRVFVSYDGASAELWRVAGDSAAKLADLANPVFHDDWSPDGSHVVVFNNDDAPSELWQVTGNSAGKLTDLPGSVFYVKWSPDGSRMFVIYDDGASAELWRVAGDSAGKLADLANSVFHDDWSPDGSHVVVFNDHGVGELWRVAGDSAAKLADLSDIAPYVEWSPDGGHLVLHYSDAPSELWRLEEQHPSLIALGLGLGRANFQGENSRLLLKYDDNRIYLLNLEWLNALGLNPARLSPDELLATLCAGPLQSTLMAQVEDEFLAYLDEREPVACRPEMAAE